MILKGLALEAPERYPGIAELQQALQAAGLGMQPPPPGNDREPPPLPPTPPARPARRAWLPWALVGLLAIAFVVALVRPFGTWFPANDDGDRQSA